MRTLTANVFVTKSLPAIDKLFFADHRLETFQESLKTLSKTEFEDSFIASPLRNDGLTHFEYNFQANGNVEERKGINVVMRLQETSKLLEMFLLENDPLARLLEDRQEKINRISKSSKATDLPGDPFNDLDLKDKLRRSSRYYLTFGTSDNIKDWSGPYSMELVGATLLNDENNVRSIEVTFIPDTQSFKSYSPNLGKLMGYNASLTNLSQFVTADSSLDAFAKQKMGDCEDKEFDLDYRLRTLLKQYIGSFTKNDNNAIVAFPQKFGRLKVLKEGEAGARARAAYDVVGMPRSLQGPQPSTQEVMDAIAESAKLGSTLVPIDSIFNSVEDIRETGVLVNKFSEFHDFVKSTSLSNNTGTARKALADYLTQIVSNVESIQGAGRMIQRVSQIKRESLEALPDIDKKFEEQQERLRDQAIDEAERKHGRALGEAINLQNSRNDRINEIVQNTATGDFTIALLASPFINDLINSNLPGSTINSGNVLELAQSAARAERDFKFLLADTEKDSSIRAANGRYTNNLKPDSFIRKKYRRVQSNKRARKQQISDISTSATNIIEGTKRDLRKKSSERAEAFKKLNTQANWDLITSPEYVSEKGSVEYQTLSFAMEQRNLAPQEVHDGFSPLVAPMAKFVASIKDKTNKSIKNTYYDFYEETDLRVLKLLHKHGVISDPNRAAYVFGDINEVAKILYLEDDKYDQHTLNTIFALDKFNDNGGLNPRLQEDEISKVASERYERYSREFRSELLRSEEPLELRHNVSGSNVIGLNYRLDKYIVGLLSMPVTPTLDKGAIGTTRLKLAKDTVQQVISGDVRRELAKFPSEITSDINNLVATLSEGKSSSLDLLLAIANDGALSRQKSAIDLFSFLYFMQNYDDIATKVAMHQDIQITKPASKKPRFDQYYEAILDMSKKLLVRCTVRTLPIFNRKVYLKKKCNLTGTTGGIIGFPEKLRNDAPYNGEYTVLGYKHVVSPSKIYSEFELIRRGITGNLEMSDTSVKDFLCAVLKGKLVNLEAGRQQTQRDIIKQLDETFLASKPFREITQRVANFNVALARSVNAVVEGITPNKYTLIDPRVIKQHEEFLNVPKGDLQVRIEKALKTMGCGNA